MPLLVMLSSLANCRRSGRRKRGPHRGRQAGAPRYRAAAMTKSPIWLTLGRRIFPGWERYDVGDVITADDPLVNISSGLSRVSQGSACGVRSRIDVADVVTIARCGGAAAE
jgi:hypothetical protein